MPMSQLERISKAKTRILYKSNQTFIATILLSLRIEEDNSQPTLMVGQGSIKYNSDFLATLSDDLLISALLHESWHIAYDHAGRLGNRDPLYITKQQITSLILCLKNRDSVSVLTGYTILCLQVGVLKKSTNTL